MPKPLAATTDALIKRKHDKMSGDIAFNQTVGITISFIFFTFGNHEVSYALHRARVECIKLGTDLLRYPTTQ